jgi:hypothetical protein
MKDRDDQQEITETDKAWLAGMIEGDGSIGMGFHKQMRANNRKGVAFKPLIQFANQDSRLVERVVAIMKGICGKQNLYIRECKSGFSNGFPYLQVNLVGLKAIHDVLEAIFQYLVGEKAGRAKLMLDFLNSRLSRTRVSQGNPEYNAGELIIAHKIFTTTRAKGNKERNPEVREILRDYMRNLGIEEEIVRSA